MDVPLAYCTGLWYVCTVQEHIPHVPQGRNQDLNLAKQKYQILTSHKNPS